jgi:cytoskeletal protein CcmA (bactofilin family)
VVFRRDNKVDSFQRQMSALRTQLGTPNEGEEGLADIPEIDDEEYGDAGFRNQTGGIDQDSGAYSFGSYPAESAQPQPAAGYDDEQPEIPSLPEADAGVSVVARDTVWKGEIDAENSVQVFGRFEGTITAREDVWIAEGADVDATISAERVIVGGIVAGTITASSRFEALPKGQVNADVTSPVSVVHEGATINGTFRIGGDDGESSSRDRTGSTGVIQRRTRPGS